MKYILCVTCLSLFFISTSGMAEILNVKSGQRVLFLDDVAIEKMQGLKRSMHQPEKRGAVIRGPQTRSTALWNPQAKHYVLTTLKGPYWSPDAQHWMKVDKPWPLRVDCVVYDPFTKNKQECWKALSPVPGGIEPAVSEDGIVFRKLGVPKIASGDEYNFSFDQRNRLFIATVKHGGPFGRAIFLSTSKDFRNWTSPKLTFSADKKDQILGRKNIEACFRDSHRQHPAYRDTKQFNVDVYNMSIFEYEGNYIGLPAMYHETGKVSKDWPGFATMKLPQETRRLINAYGDYTGFHHVQLVCSRDLKNWKRLGDRKPFIPLSPIHAGAYDTQTIMPPSAPLIKDDELWFYYTGARHYEIIYTHTSPKSVAVCLAVLRRDGFISLDAGPRGGSIRTKPFTVPNGTLRLNVNALGGAVTVTVLDAQGGPLRGFEQSNPISNDAARSIVTWKQAQFQSLAGKTVQLMIRMREAELYSFWIGQ